MSEEHRASCRVFVGDRLPEATLAGADGESHELSGLFGSRGTVVVFWESDNPYSVAALDEIAHRIVQPAKEQGISLVSINVGDSPEVAARTAESLGIEGAVLLDPDGEYFHRVATAYLPRIYFLEADGKIAWLDIEYSRTTFRQLRQVVQYELSEGRTAGLIPYPGAAVAAVR